MVRRYEYQPCIPTRGTEGPAGPDLVSRDGSPDSPSWRRSDDDWTKPPVTCADLRFGKFYFASWFKESPLSPEGKVRSLSSEYGQNVATFSLKERCADGGLT